MDWRSRSNSAGVLMFDIYLIFGFGLTAKTWRMYNSHSLIHYDLSELSCILSFLSYMCIPQILDSNPIEYYPLQSDFLPKLLPSHR
jgi:hypothetical protein